MRYYIFITVCNFKVLYLVEPGQVNSHVVNSKF